MTTAPPEPQGVPEKVMQAAKRNNLGDFERILPRYGRKRVFGKDEVIGRLYDFEEGLIFVGTDEVLHVFPWDKVVSVYLATTRNYYNSAYNNTIYSATLILGNGGRLSLSGLFIDPKYRDDKKNRTVHEYETYLLMLAGQQIASESQLPVTLARLQRGEEVAFGDIKLSLAGVHTAKGLVPWNTIKGVQVNNGAFQIKQAGKFFAVSRLPVGEIPNVPLFTMLVNALHANQQQ